MMAFRFPLGFDHHPLLPISRRMLMILITMALTSDLATTGRAARAKRVSAGSIKLSTMLGVCSVITLDCSPKRLTFKALETSLSGITIPRHGQIDNPYQLISEVAMLNKSSM